MECCYMLHNLSIISFSFHVNLKIFSKTLFNNLRYLKPFQGENLTWEEASQCCFNLSLSQKQRWTTSILWYYCSLDKQDVKPGGKNSASSITQLTVYAIYISFCTDHGRSIISVKLSRWDTLELVCRIFITVGGRAVVMTIISTWSCYLTTQKMIKADKD